MSTRRDLARLLRKSAGLCGVEVYAVVEECSSPTQAPLRKEEAKVTKREAGGTSAQGVERACSCFTGFVLRA